MAHHANSPDTQPLTNDYDDAISECSSSTEESIRKPLHSFDTLDDVEDGYIRRPQRRSWWDKYMAVRPRRRRSVDEDQRSEGMKEVLDDAALASLYDRRRTKRTWYNYCVFGGISGLSILAFLLFVNLALGAATMIWSSDIDKVLQNWGQPGSGTEGLSWYPTDFTRDILPIPCHSHNDYWRKVPLFSALRAGCTGTEADVWLFDDDLYVGHNTASLTRNRTFQSLYINPLVQILEKQNPNTDFFNGTYHGVFDTDPGKSLTLLVDVKTSGPETWPWVLKQLEPLRERGWLSFVQNNTLHMRPVTVVGTGNTPFDVLTANATYRDAFFDAPLETMWEPRHGHKHNSPEFDAPAPGELPSTLPEEESTTPETTLPTSSPLTNVGQGLSGTTADSEFNSTNSYYASVSFGRAVGRIWRGRLSGKQMAIIRGQIRGAHRRGLKVRYWDTPGWPLGLRNHVWDILVREGADVLNVDDLRAASKLAW